LHIYSFIVLIPICQPDSSQEKANVGSETGCIRQNTHLAASLQNSSGRTGKVRVYNESPLDIVLTQIQMPGPDGLQLLHRIKEHGPSVPVIVMTGYRSEKIRKRALPLGADEYLYKLFHMDDLLEMIEELLTREH
jgi:DNA-binding response OmpR family regulator